MANPEMPREGMENKEQNEGFLITFPDGTTGRYKSRDEAVEAMQEWREAA